VDVEANSGKDCHNPDITIDADDKPCVAYLNTDDATVDAVQGNTNNATSFNSFQVDTNIDGSFSTNTPSIAVDNSGNHWVTWHDSLSRSGIREHQYGDTWTTTWQTIAFNTTDGVRGSLVIDGTDKYLIYEDPDDNDIKYNLYTTSWQGENDLETGTYNSPIGKWAFWVDNDSTGALVSQSQPTYYFNDNTPNDVNTQWTEDEKAFDGSTSTLAYTTSASTSDYLEGDGTTAPTSGDFIEEVEVRVYGGYDSGSGNWSSYVSLTTPSGGWTWTKLNGLTVRIYPQDMGGPVPSPVTMNAGVYDGAVLLGTTSASSGSSEATTHDAYKVEIKVSVISRSASTEIDYVFADEVSNNEDIHWNYIPENLWIFLSIVPFVPKLFKKEKNLIKKSLI
jgi:hypothetical protein